MSRTSRRSRRPWRASVTRLPECSIRRYRLIRPSWRPCCSRPTDFTSALRLSPVAASCRCRQLEDESRARAARCLNCLAIVPGLPPLGAADTSRATGVFAVALLSCRATGFRFSRAAPTDGTSWGAATSGSDIVDRHDYLVEALHNSRWAENSAWLWYRYAGFGLPLIDLYASQNFSNANFVFVDGAGNLSRAVRDAQRARARRSLQATFIRPRFRTYTLASFGRDSRASAIPRGPTRCFSSCPVLLAAAQLPGADRVGGLVERAAPRPEHLARGWNQRERERTAALAGRHDRRRHSQRRGRDVGLQVARPPGFCAPRARASRRGRNHR